VVRDEAVALRPVAILREERVERLSNSSFGGRLSTSVGKTVSLWDYKQKCLL
jgi:hypothetical protein